MPVSEDELRALVGHRFPGGEYCIAHWENFLLTEATGSDPLPDGLAHPAHLFHVPIAGAGTSIAELFALGQAASDASISIDYYDWELFGPLREDEPYVVQGGITEYERSGGGERPIVDSLTFRIEMAREGGELAARVTFRWHFWRFSP
jgi:hypothetical protein